MAFAQGKSNRALQRPVSPSPMLHSQSAIYKAPTPSNFLTPSTSKSKKPFFTAVKATESFGSPTPLPARSSTPDRKPSSPGMDALEQDEFSGSASIMLQRKSVRWLQLSSTFWSTVVMDAQRIINKEALGNFCEVLTWRVQNSITEDEFSSLFFEWMNHKSQGGKKKQILGLLTIRQILMERDYSETDLDLFIGVVLNESNKGFINSPLSFNSAAVPASMSSSSLELCSKIWISTAEEIFFLLDSSGYGSLHFDETYFLAACLISGFGGWKSEDEMESALSVSGISYCALQLLRDAGASATLFNKETGPKDAAGSSRAVYGNNAISSASSLKTVVTKRFSISLTMFKNLLIRRGMGEIALTALLKHVKSALEKMLNVCQAYASDVVQSCIPLENLEGIGSPRLWEYCVLKAAGISRQVVATQPPPIALFLLTDAEKYISGSVKSSPKEFDSFLLQCRALMSLESSSSSTLRPSTEPFFAAKYDMEIHETARKMTNAFRMWNGSGLHTTRLSAESNQITFTASDLSLIRNPVYQLIISSLMEYKRMQMKVAAAFADISEISGNGNCNSVRSSATSLACALLLPKIDKIENDLSNEDNNYVSEFEGGDAAVETDGFVETAPETSVERLDSNKGDNEQRKNTKSPKAKAKNVKVLDTAQWSTVFAAPVIPVSSPTNTTNQRSKSTSSMPEQSPDITLLNKLLEARKDGEQDVIIDRINKIKLATTSLQTSPTSTGAAPAASRRSSMKPVSSTSSQLKTDTSVSKVPMRRASESIALSRGFEADREEMTSPVSLKSTDRTETEYSASANTIAELLAQGQSVGKYAQSLREILRKMSQDDSKIKLNSLKQIIELGEIISGNTDLSIETNDMISPQRAVRSGITPATEKRRAMTATVTNGAGSTTKAPFEDGTFRVPVRNAYNETVRYKSPSKRESGRTPNKFRYDEGIDPLVNSISATRGQNKQQQVSQRRIPGVLPDENSRRTPKKVFGHPL